MTEQTLPSGVVTLLFSDIEGSTRLLEALGEAYGGLLAAHQEILRAAVRVHGGHVVSARGDEFFAAFADASAAVAAAADAQIGLLAHPWGDRPLRVRMGLHTGEASALGDDYVGLAVHHASRVCDAGNGGQIVLSDATRDAVATLPDGVDLLDLGKHRLKDLSKPVRLYQLTHTDLPAEFAPLRTLSELTTNLPVQVTSFIGREDETRDVIKHLEVERLVTLVGPGGVGKTRLALQVAADVVDRFADGAWLVELSAVSDPSRVSSTVIETLSINAESVDEESALVRGLAERDILVVLDNCEHLIAECARIVELLLTRCPRVRVLATSREPLNLRGETTVRIDPLELPVDVHPEALSESPAVRLFLDRAAQARPDFALSTQNASLVAEICARLDGIPLAIELAASLVRAIGPADIAQRLRNRLGLLAHGARDAGPQQRTLREAIDWSHDLLNEGERIVFRRLAVFPGAFTLDATEEVCGAGLEAEIVGTLVALVDRSLVTVDGFDSRTRYRLLEMIREYAAEQLDASSDGDDLRDRLVKRSLALVKGAANAPDDEKTPWFERIDDDIESIRFALERSIEREDAESALILAAGFGGYCDARGLLTEGRRWLDRALEMMPGGDRPGLALALHYSGWLAFRQGDTATGRLRFAERRAVDLAAGRPTIIALNGLGACALHEGNLEEARELFQESLDECRLAGDPNVSFAVSNLGLVAEALGDYDAAQRYFEETIELSRGRQDPRELCSGLTNLGNVLFRRGDIKRARANYEEALAISRQYALRGDEATLLMNLGAMDFSAGRYDESRPRLQASLEMYRQMGDVVGTRRVLGNLTNVEIAVGGYGAARAFAHEGLAMARRVGDREGIGASLIGIGQADCAQGDLAGAREAYDEALQLFEDVQAPYGVAVCRSALAVVAAQEVQWDEADRLFGGALALFREMGEPEGAAESLVGLAWVDRARERFTEAASRLSEARAMFDELGHERGMTDLLDEYAALATVQGRAEQGAALLGASDALRQRIGAPRQPFGVDERERLGLELRAALGPDQFEELLARGESVDLDVETAGL